MKTRYGPRLLGGPPYRASRSGTRTASFIFERADRQAASMDEVERGDERRGDERRGDDRRGAGSDARRQLQVRWGKVVREDEDPDRPPPEPRPESPAKRIARERRRSVRRRQAIRQVALAVSLAVIAILVLQGIMNG